MSTTEVQITPANQETTIALTAQSTAVNPEASPVKVMMTYHDNKVNLPFAAGGGYNLIQATYTITDLSITSGQDPDGKNKIGQTKQWAGKSGSATWSVGRKGSSDVATWWKNRIAANKTTFNHDPGDLNFAFLGNLTLSLQGGILGSNEDLYTIPGVGIGQGHSGATNNWWFGGQTGLYQGDDTVRLQGKSSSGFAVNFFFRRGGSGSPVDEIKLTSVEFTNYRMFALGSKYVGENVRDTWQSGSPGGAGKLPPFVTYYNSTQSDTLRLTVKNNLLYTSSGKLFDTRGADISHSNVPVAIFTIDQNSNVYASNQFKVFMFHHSTILGGAPVASAGELQVTQGKITFMSNMSGHYQPDAATAHLQLTEALYRQGYTTTIPMTVGDYSMLMY